MKTILEELRETERDYPPEMYACYRIGHMVGRDGRCYCCLEVIPPVKDKK